MSYILIHCTRRLQYHQFVMARAFYVRQRQVLYTYFDVQWSVCSVRLYVFVITGSGKTLAYLVPLINRLRTEETVWRIGCLHAIYYGLGATLSERRKYRDS